MTSSPRPLYGRCRLKMSCYDHVCCEGNSRSTHCMAGSNRVPKHSRQTIRQWQWTRTTCSWLNQSQVVLKCGRIGVYRSTRLSRRKHTKPKRGIRALLKWSIQDTQDQKSVKKGVTQRQYAHHMHFHIGGCIIDTLLHLFFLYNDIGRTSPNCILISFMFTEQILRNTY